MRPMVTIGNDRDGMTSRNGIMAAIVTYSGAYEMSRLRDRNCRESADLLPLWHCSPGSGEQALRCEEEAPAHRLHRLCDNRVNRVVDDALQVARRSTKDTRRSTKHTKIHEGHEDPRRTRRSTKGTKIHEGHED